MYVSSPRDGSASPPQMFEHFGIRRKSDLPGDTKERVEKWSPDFKVKGKLYDRLCALLAGEASLDAKSRRELRPDRPDISSLAACGG